jgi:hypothetical protein
MPTPSPGQGYDHATAVSYQESMCAKVKAWRGIGPRLRGHIGLPESEGDCENDPAHLA